MNYIDYLSTDIGIIFIRASDKGITHLFFVEEKQQAINPNTITEQCKQQLVEYFNADRKVFDLPLEQKGTEFQKQVWQTLLNIPYGEIASYRDIAEQLNKPKAVRAVGAANGKNPISIIVPCHRVIGSDGKLTGYAGGLERKEWLLKHEGILVKNDYFIQDLDKQEFLFTE